MAVDIGIAHPGPAGDLGDGEAVHALFADNLKSGLDNLFPADMGDFFRWHDSSL
jgi:hypothetical protein